MADKKGERVYGYVGEWKEGRVKKSTKLYKQRWRAEREIQHRPGGKVKEMEIGFQLRLEI